MNMFKLAISILWLNVRIIKKIKGRAMNVTLSDESESTDSDKSEDKKMNFMALITFVKSTGGGESRSASFDFVESSQDESNDHEDNLQASYDKVFFFFEEYANLRKLNKNVFKMLNELEREKATLLAKLDDSTD